MRQTDQIRGGSPFLLVYPASPSGRYRYVEVAYWWEDTVSAVLWDSHKGTLSSSQMCKYPPASVEWSADDRYAVVYCRYDGTDHAWVLDATTVKSERVFGGQSYFAWVSALVWLSETNFSMPIAVCEPLPDEPDNAISASDGTELCMTAAREKGVSIWSIKIDPETTSLSGVDVGLKCMLIADGSCSESSMTVAHEDTARMADPFIASVAPATVEPGSIMHIGGYGFGEPHTKAFLMFGNLRIGSDDSQILQWSSTSIRLRIPVQVEPHSGVQVFTAFGSSNVDTSFAVISRPTINIPYNASWPELRTFQEINIHNIRLGIVSVATNELEGWFIAGTDQCYGGALSGLSVAVKTAFIRIGLNDLALGVFGAGLGTATANAPFINFLVKAGISSLRAYVREEAVGVALGVSIAESAGGYIFAKGTHEFFRLGGSVLTGLTVREIHELLDRERLVTMDISGDNRRYIQAKPAMGVPLTYFKARATYNPWNHYVVILLDAVCAEPDHRETERLYFISFRVDGAFGAAKLVPGTFRVETINPSFGSGIR